jgi:hypothetical protein
MPGSGYNSHNIKLARAMLEACRFSYKAYAQSCSYPLDPFFESHGASDSARDRLMESVHADYKTSADAAKFDPVDYDLKKPPNPSEGVVYRGGVKDEPYILFQPRDLDKSIAHHTGFDLDGREVPHGGGAIGSASGRKRCAYFQGKTGMTKTWKTSGWPTWLGAVIYDPETNTVTIVFRGSRSGNGARALIGAKLKSKGSPDWVTDMNYLKSEDVEKFGGASLCCGFYYAYESAKRSIAAAYRSAVGVAIPSAVYITGHSLGGGLAQVAYLDFTCGDLAREITFAQSASSGVNAWAPVQCFAISAPPVIIGRESHRKLAMDADATQILHYFCPGDAVHCSPLLDSARIPTAMRAGNWVLENFSHPLTDPVHVGCEIQLESNSSFPESHEPRDVYRGLHAGTLDPHFWPTFVYNHTADAGPYISDLTTGAPVEALRDALEHSIPPDRALARAMLWRSVIKNESKAEAFTNDITTWQKAVNLAEELQTRNVSQSALNSVKASIKELRKSLVAGARSTGSMATSSSYWTLLQGLSVREEFAR